MKSLTSFFKNLSGAPVLSLAFKYINRMLSKEENFSKFMKRMNTKR